MGTPALLFICLEKVKHNHRDSLRNFEKFLFYSIVLLFHGCWVFSYLSEGISYISLNFILPFSFMYFFSEFLYFFLISLLVLLSTFHVKCFTQMNGEPWLSIHIRCCVWASGWASGSHCGVMRRELILPYVSISASFLLSQRFLKRGPLWCPIHVLGTSRPRRLWRPYHSVCRTLLPPNSKL